MRSSRIRLGLLTVLTGILSASLSAAPVELVVSVPEQKMYVFDESGEKVASYKISTSARGLGDSAGSYATPLGRLAVAAKIGAGAALGTIFKAGRNTGKICPVNAKGRDPIVTRILHLRGTEAQNARAYGRCIYIHGTPEERHLGKPMSYGCIRMRSADVVELFDKVDVGTSIEIVQERVASLFGGVTRRPTRLMAVASAPVESETKVAVATKTGSISVKSASLLASTSRPVQEAIEKSSPASGTHMRLLETSGLTVNFGGGTEFSDRPR